MSFESIVNALFMSVYKTGYNESKFSVLKTGYTICAHKKGRRFESTEDDAPFLFIDQYNNWHIMPNGSNARKFPYMALAISELETRLVHNGLAKSIWIDFKLPVNIGIISSIVPAHWEITTDVQNDCVRDYQQDSLSFRRWLLPEEECKHPPGATHNIGATAVLIDEKNGHKYVLLVEKAGRKGSWFLPGGSYDPKKDQYEYTAYTAYTALRELCEETGLDQDVFPKTTAYLVGQMNFFGNQLAPAMNQTWYLPGCGQIEWPLNPPKDEIAQACWVSVQDIIESQNGTAQGLKIGAGIKSALTAIQQNKGLSVVEENLWFTVIGAK